MPNENSVENLLRIMSRNCNRDPWFEIENTMDILRQYINFNLEHGNCSDGNHVDTKPSETLNSRQINIVTIPRVTRCSK